MSHIGLLSLLTKHNPEWYGTVILERRYDGVLTVNMLGKEEDFKEGEWKHDLHGPVRAHDAVLWANCRLFTELLENPDSMNDNTQI